MIRVKKSYLPLLLACVIALLLKEYVVAATEMTVAAVIESRSC